MDVGANRPLSEDERRLARWLLESGNSAAAAFLPQLDAAEATPWRCPCGCASFNFQIKGRPVAPPGVHILGHFLFDSGGDLSGIFIFESGGTLSGVEVYGFDGDAPSVLPRPEALRPFEQPIPIRSIHDR